MATLGQTQQLLQQRRQQIESAKKEVEEFVPRPQIPQSVLRQPIKSGSRVSPMLVQARLKSLIGQREKAKSLAQERIKTALTEQQALEKKFKEFKETPSGKLQSVLEKYDYETIRKIGEPVYSGGSYAVPGGSPVLFALLKSLGILPPSLSK